MSAKYPFRWTIPSQPLTISRILSSHQFVCCPNPGCFQPKLFIIFPQLMLHHSCIPHPLFQKLLLKPDLYLIFFRSILYTNCYYLWDHTMIHCGKSGYIFFHIFRIFSEYIQSSGFRNLHRKLLTTVICHMKHGMFTIHIPAFYGKTFSTRSGNIHTGSQIVLQLFKLSAG